MKFITVRDLRNRTSQVLEGLGRGKAVVTSRGRPVGILVGTGEDFERSLRAIERAEAAAAVSALRERAAAGTAGLTPAEIEREITAARRA